APSKNVIHAAKVANYFRRGAEFGIAAGDWRVEMPAVRDRRNDALAHREDRDVSEALRELFDDEGIEVLTATPVARVEGRSGESVRLHATHGVIEGSDLLVASGRTPNTDGIGLETAGIERDDRGFIKVDERLRTTAAGVWAVGDCAGSPHFTHIADDDVRVIRDNLAGIDRVTTGRLVPF